MSVGFRRCLHCRLFNVSNIALALLVMVTLSSCAAVRQYPDDPEDTDTSLASYSQYFGSEPIEAYSQMEGAARTRQRDSIVLNRMLAFDIMYSRFKRRLLIDGNSIVTGGDLIALTLTTVATVTGNAATKSTLAAAATGVLGAKSAISTDLFYQRTLPTLIAQIDANRARAKLALMTGLAKDDSEYPLGRALVDLNELKDAGGVTQAIDKLAAAATADKQASDDEMALIHGQAFKDTIGSRELIVKDIGALTDVQILKLAMAMAPNLATRSPELRSKVTRVVPVKAWTTDAAKARRALKTWASMDQPPNATDRATAATYVAEWNTAIAAAKK